MAPRRRRVSRPDVDPTTPPSRATEPGERSRILQVLRRHGLRPKKGLGQHFLADPTHLDRIVGLADLSERDAVLEVGAGIGTLTVRLAERAGAVTAVEVDPALLPALREAVAGHPNVRVVATDAMTLDLAAQFPQGFARKVVSNLPYQIASTLIVRMLDEVSELERLVLTVQREVAERIVAEPGTRAYGLLTLLVAYRAHARIAGRIPPGAFVPPPRVESAVVVLRPRTPPAVADPVLLRTLMRAAFAQRRKQLRNAWRQLAPAEQLERAARQAGIDLRRRGEAVGLAEFVAVADAIARIRDTCTGE
ncbi:MAG: 16S rRNA (adenine(1518)-N(6)/adenine(1519)-N(6))-dimethyltransferase RsmA [Armatimonadota bacterium]|nr:16S rRNA (adenine(1518)-N(6)/adenine(1519)-N(6))-dimethyltransferase RsmA [Armatimonadota bacterium]MDR5696935.1 16S rRNA (adenine(1518)-N(6)/adenine(1519)-N(6))-dimethyltransferase RsmA [Armatimonadota bacterium]